jgi:CheY-like chemotaxis protein
VDDQPGKLLSYEVILSELGENLIKAMSGPQALEQLLKNIAVVLLDVNMPGQDGFELANIIRQHPRFEKTAIIFISAVRVTDIDRLTGFEQGGGGLYFCSDRAAALKSKSSWRCIGRRKNWNG